MTRKPNLIHSGFTLLELLVAASIFVGVAILSAGALIATVRIQNSQKVSKNVNVQTESALQEIAFKAERSNGLIDPDVITTSVRNPGSGANPKDEILFLLVYRTDEGGATTPFFERHIFCAEPQYQIPGVSTTTVLGKRLVDFRLPQNHYYRTGPGLVSTTGAFRVFGAFVAAEDTLAGALGDDGIAMGSLSSIDDMQCTKSKLAKLYTISDAAASALEANISSRYLTDPTLNVINFRVWPVWFGTITAGQFYDKKPQGIRVEMTTRYNPGNTSATSDIEKRVGQDEQVSPQVVSKILINLTTKHSYWP